STASNEQSAGIEQVSRAVSQMDQVTQQNVALVEEAAAAANSLQDQSGQLAKAVSIFKLASDHGVSRTPGTPGPIAMFSATDKPMRALLPLAK
ncbi:MAG: hypothetical protein EOO81_07775, partial [Oxalobacteraceae bacterium]